MSLQRQRQLQQSDNESPVESIPRTTVPEARQHYVSLYWSMVLLPGETPQPQNTDGTIMADWLLDGFLCTQEEVWMGNALNLMRNDCLIGENTVDFGTIADSHEIILWNKPTVDLYTEQLEYIEGVQYEVWTVQYPLFTNWVNGEVEEHTSDPADEDSTTRFQQKLQTLLEDQIRHGQLQSDRGVPSIMGREMETYWLLRFSSNAPKVSLYWSMVLLQGESPHAQNADGTIMADWLLDDFLCNQEKVWMGNALNLLRNDCLFGWQNKVDFGTISGSHDIVLWNKPTVDWYMEELEDTEGVQYEVWTVQYPFFTKWDPTDEDSTTQFQTPQEKLQTLLEDQIRNGELQSDRGVATIMGREMETYWLFNAPKMPPLLVPGLEGQETLVDLPGSLQPYDGQVLQIVGVLVAVIHTSILLFLNCVVKPCLKKRAEKQREQKSEGKPQMTGKSLDDLARSFNVWLGGHQQHPQLTQNVHQRHFLEAPKTSFSAQMPDDDSLVSSIRSDSHHSELVSSIRSDLLTSIREVPAEEEEDSHHSDLLFSIREVSVEEEEEVAIEESCSPFSSSSPNVAIKPSSLLDPPAQSSSTQRLLDSPASLLSKPVGGTKLAPMSSYFYGNNLPKVAIKPSSLLDPPAQSSSTQRLLDSPPSLLSKPVIGQPSSTQRLLDSPPSLLSKPVRGNNLLAPMSSYLLGLGFMPDDDSHHSDLPSSIGDVSAEEEETIEEFCSPSSSSLLDPPGQSSSTQQLLDPPPSLLSKPVRGNNLLAPMSSYFHGNNSRDDSQKSLPRSSRSSIQESYEDEDPEAVYHT